jgi:hypothetical protein
MKKIKSIQLKSAFLLTVFSLNTIIGFACAVGLDMGFNSHHHEQEVAETSVRVHSDGKQHQHHNEVKDHHDETVNDHHPTNDKDNCCNDEVMKFQQVDKAIASSVTLLSPVFFTSFLASFYNIDILSSKNRTSDIKYFVRSHHPPIPDIRIAIQSFQI